MQTQMRACGDIEPGQAVVMCECGAVRQHGRAHGYRREVGGSPDPSCSGCHGTGRVVDWTPPDDRHGSMPIETPCSCLRAYHGAARDVTESIALAMQTK